MMHVYRFHDLVAFNPPEGATFYLQPSEARQLAKALMECVNSISFDNFAKSTVGTITIKATGSCYGVGS